MTTHYPNTGKPFTADQLCWDKRGLPFDIKTHWRLEA